MPTEACDHDLRSNTVFINCPYDTRYEPYLDALVFTVVCCGMTPSCAVSDERIDKTRISRIADGLRMSKYSIHDLSRCQGEGDFNLARMNMPLELGMAMEHGLRDDHRWMALAPKEHAYSRFVSDLQAYDLPQVAGSPDNSLSGEPGDNVVCPVLSWLRVQPGARTIKGLHPAKVWNALRAYRAKLKVEREDKGWANFLAWDDRVRIARTIAKTKGLLRES